MSTRLQWIKNIKRLISLLSLLMVFLFTALAFSGNKTSLAAPGSEAVKDSEYAGTETCRQCHEEEYQKFKETKMGHVVLANPSSELEARGCESCHGPGKAHAEAGGDKTQIIRLGAHSDLPMDVQERQCMQCHEKGNRMFWEGSTHDSRGVSCVSCHKVMSRNVASSRFMEPLTDSRSFGKTTRMETCFECHKLKRAQLQRSSHMPFREGKVTCTNCHNPHGTPNPKLLIEATTNDNCYKCHAERRGPFLWEHPPVMENCLNCHDAHGASNHQMLKVRQPRLCNQCHIEARHPTTPQMGTTRFAFNRGCTNCHSQIHGSNHPSGVRFQR